jgi:polyhydroxyalkanoate synthesis regulator phasin
MAEKKPLERYMEAGKEFTETSRKRVQKVAHELARESEVGREHAEDWADEFVQRGRRSAGRRFASRSSSSTSRRIRT